MMKRSWSGAQSVAYHRTTTTTAKKRRLHPIRLPDELLLSALAHLSAREVDWMRFVSRAHRALVDKYGAVLPKHPVGFATNPIAKLEKENVVCRFASHRRGKALSANELRSMLESRRMGREAALDLSPWGMAGQRAFIKVFREAWQCNDVEHLTCYVPLNCIYLEEKSGGEWGGPGQQQEKDFLPFLAQHGGSESVVLEFVRLDYKGLKIESHLDYGHEFRRDEPPVLRELVNAILGLFRGYQPGAKEPFRFPKQGLLLYYETSPVCTEDEPCGDPEEAHIGYLLSQGLNNFWESMLGRASGIFKVGKWAGGHFPGTDNGMLKLDNFEWKVWRKCLVPMGVNKKGQVDGSNGASPYLRVMQKIRGGGKPGKYVSLIAHFRVFETIEDEKEVVSEEKAGKNNQSA